MFFLICRLETFFTVSSLRIKMNICRMVGLESALKESLIYNRTTKNGQAPNFAKADQGMAFDLTSENYIEVLKSGKEVFDKLPQEWATSEELKNSLTCLLKTSSLEKFLEIACVGVSCLQLFVEINWLGFPPLNWPQLLELIPQLNAFGDSDGDQSRADFLNRVRAELVLDGEYLLSVVQNIELFYFARLFLQHLEGISNSFTMTFTILWWRLRVLMIHQQLLEDKSEQIFKAAKTLISDIDTVVNESDKQTMHYVHYLVEIAAFYDKYYDVNKARESLEKASSLVGLDLNYTGALGKRTKFQANDFAQLTLDVGRKDDISVVEALFSTSDSVNASLMPSDVKLDDEVRLERINFKDENRSNVSDLALVEQTIVLGNYFLQKRSKPRDALTQEELAPYLDVILRQKKTCWSIKMSALLQRSLLENDHSRTAERSLMQLETLVEHWPVQDRDQRHRMNQVYSSILFPFWVIEGELVHLLISLGSIKAALDRALKIQQWSEVIVCYNRLNLKHKSAEVILHQIEEKGESAHLYCLLGDATENIEHYKKALVLSQNRSSRAFRSLGLYHYFRKEYAEAVDYFQKSLDLNSFQLETLLRLGYSAIQIEAWDVAASTYWKYCSYETENFEAWNNLSNSYIKLGQKARAWKVLQEAVKCDYDNWKIWDNLMVVSTDCAEFDEVFRSYHRLLDIKEGKHLDLEVLAILVQAINNNTIDNSGIGSGRHRTLALKLFGRLTSHYVSESKLWRLYAQLVAGDANLTPESPGNAENTFKAAQFMQKSLGAAVQAKDWSKSRENCVQTLELASETVDFCLNASNCSENKAQSIQQLASLKLTLNSALTKVKTSQISMSSDELVEEVKPSFEKLQQDVQLIIERIAALKQC